MLEAAIFCCALAARHLAQILLTYRHQKGIRKGFVSTALLFSCYVSGMVMAFVSLLRSTSPVPALVWGAGLWGVAIALRMWALVHLSEHFSSFIEISEHHKLIKSGPYAIIRHPLHLAFGLEVCSFALLAWTAAAALPAAAVWVVIAVRNRTEEAELLRHFGPLYEEYRSNVGALLPIKGLLRLCRRLG